MFLLEKRARGRNTSSITGKNWKWRTFKLTRQTLEYYNIDKLRGSYDMNQSIARECYTMECADKKFAFTIQNNSEMFFLNASSEVVRQTCINMFNRSSTNANWDNNADNQQALKDVEAKMLELVLYYNHHYHHHKQHHHHHHHTQVTTIAIIKSLSSLLSSSS